MITSHPLRAGADISSNTWQSSVRPALAIIRSHLESEQKILDTSFETPYYYDPKSMERYDWPLFDAEVSEMVRVSSGLGAEFAFYVGIWNDDRVRSQPSGQSWRYDAGGE